MAEETKTAAGGAGASAGAGKGPRSSDRGPSKYDPKTIASVGRTLEAAIRQHEEYQQDEEDLRRLREALVEESKIPSRASRNAKMFVHCGNLLVELPRAEVLGLLEMDAQSLSTSRGEFAEAASMARRRLEALPPSALREAGVDLDAILGGKDSDGHTTSSGDDSED